MRVSTEEQNEARQREALKQYRIEKWFCEKRSAKDTNRPQLEAMLEFARSGDTIYIHDFSRLLLPCQFVPGSLSTVFLSAAFAVQAVANPAYSAAR